MPVGSMLWLCLEGPLWQHVVAGQGPRANLEGSARQRPELRGEAGVQVATVLGQSPCDAVIGKAVTRRSPLVGIADRRDSVQAL